MTDIRRHHVTRRSVVAGSAALSAGFMVTRRSSLAQDATPVGIASPVADITPLGYVVMRMRQLDGPESRDIVNAQAVEQFAPAIAELDGFLGYLMADVIDDPALTLTVTVMADQDAMAATDAVVADFVSQDDVAQHVNVDETRSWAGDLLMLATPAEAESDAATPPLEDFGAGYYITARIFTTFPGTDARNFVTEAQETFVPIVLGIPGFVGYLWFPIEQGFVALSLYDSEESAIASTEAAVEWANEHLVAYTDTPPEVFNGTIVHADLPILA